MKANHYSGTFLKWAEPLLALFAEAPRAAKASALDTAAATWNAVTLDDAGLAPGAIEKLLKQMSELPGPGKTIFPAIATELITRRRREFATEKWTIGKCELRGHDDDTCVFVEARALQKLR